MVSLQHETAMLIIRKIGKTLRGQAKPYQIITAAILGSLIGFAPPIGNAPLYIVGVVLLLAILNANFFIATFTAGVAKLLALALMPLSFELGLILVDGPLQGLFTTLINAPVTALMGFDYYVTAGGTVIAVIVGALMGVGYMKLIGSFRKKMAKVEADSEKYADFVSKRSVRIVMWVLFGGKAKVSYAELMEQKKIGNPIRPLGVVFAVLVVGLLFLVQQFFSGPLITTLLRGQLEAFHGATVDVEGVKIDLANGQLTVDQLAMADPDNLATDLIRAKQVQAKVSTADLLRKRIVIDTILIDDAVQGAKRDRPGVLIGKRPEPSVPEDAKTIEDWFAKAKTWKDRLDTFRYWLEKLRGSDDKGAADEQEKGRLRQWADLYGHADVRAEHLIEGSPTVLVRDAKINKLRAQWPNEETLDIHATNLSTHPTLAPDKPHIAVNSSANTFDLGLSIAPRAKAEMQSTLKLTLRNQSIDETMEGLDVGSNTAFTGGTWQAGINGKWSDLDGLNLPLTLVLENTKLAMPGLEPTPVASMPLEFGITGEMDEPTVDIDYEKLIASLKKNVGNAVVNQYVGKASDELKNRLSEELGGDLGDEVGGLIGDILGGNKKDKDGNSEDEQESNEDDLGDKVREGLGGFLKRGDDDE
ncbi:MAG: hypothetical protein KTR15_06920 [Phycisphaeraceae bacterium]|nr:hypothetical protein [Phycisphaeraceae bacterium]